MLLRNVWVLGANLVRQAIRSGNWWLPIVILMLAVAVIIAATAKVVVPTTVYVLF